MFPAMLLAMFAQPKLPPVTLRDLERFPSREAASQHTKFAWDHYSWIYGEAPSSDWSHEAYAMWSVWRDLELAEDASCAESYRLLQLSCVRYAIGAQAYYQGIMPPPAPYWRFKEIQQ